ncbi:hypothetical protein ACNI3K_06770 [Demequina sp. SO4-13]|uniref:hypothetical protein n=1 Tax=Demequina sp. SO4-13 TaxID=3401027 RepID=UPI003AF969C2
MDDFNTDARSMNDFNNDRFVEAKSELSMEQIVEIIAERETFLADDMGELLGQYGAAIKLDRTGEGGASWMVEPEFREFLKRSL